MWKFLLRTKPVEKVETCEDETCTICSETIGAVRQDGTTEIAYMLPCSHTFGNLCILGWLEVAPQKDCPNCRRRLVHPGCGHLIMPHKLSTAPPSIPASETPMCCFQCRGKGFIADALGFERERLRLQEEALQGMRMHLPRFFGTQSAMTVSTVDQRIEELRKGFIGFHERTWRSFEFRERRTQW